MKKSLVSFFIIVSVFVCNVNAQIKLLQSNGSLIDTSLLLSGKLKKTDTAAMLLPYLRKLDTIKATNFWLVNTSTDAGNNNTSAIERTGSISSTSNFLRSGSSGNKLTIDAFFPSGSSIYAGDVSDSLKYFRIGPFNLLNNFDTKAKDFHIYSSTVSKGIYFTAATGNVSVNNLTANTVASASSGSIAANQKAKFTVTGGLASINTLNIGLGGKQISTNTALGFGTLYYDTTGAANTAVGYQSLYFDSSGSNNTAAGFQSMYKNTSGANNTAIGFQTLSNNVSGSNNTSLGANALYLNTTGVRNTAIGWGALTNNSSSDENTALGYSALSNNSLGRLNTALGAFSLFNNTIGNYNTAIGDSTLFDLTTGNKNTAIGSFSGLGITTGSANTIIGANVRNLSSSLSNNIIVADGDGNRRVNVIANGNMGINNLAPNNKLEITKDSVGASGLRFTNLTNLNTAASSSSVKQKFLSVNNLGDVVLATVADDVISVTGLSAGLVSPVAAATFQLGVFENSYSAIDSTVIYVNQVDGTQWVYSAASGGIYKSYAAPASTEWYIASSTNDAGSNKTGTIYRNAAVAIGVNTPNSSAILDLSASNKAFLPPRMTKNQRDSIATPEAGMMAYCTDCSSGKGCLSLYTTSWNCFLDDNNSPSVSANCSTGIVGTFTKAFALSSAYFQITLTNNSYASVTIAVGIADLTLSGASSGITVGSVSTTVGGTAVTSVTISSGASQVIYYNLTGTPSSAGTLTATWSKITLSCIKTKTIGDLSSILNTTCATTAALNGAYINSAAFTSSNTFTISVTNKTAATINGFPAPAIGNLVLSNTGTSSPALSVSAVSPSATFNLAANATQLITYTLSGTPTSSGTLMANWTYGDLTCSKTKTISALSSLFNTNYCTDSSSVQGAYVSAVAFTSSNTFVVKLTNISGAALSLPAPATTNLTKSFTGTGTISIASVSPSTALSIAAGATQTITYTLSGTPTSTGTLSLNWVYGDLSCNKNQNIGLGDATFASSPTAFVFSVNDVSLTPNIVTQGTLAIGTTVQMPYTGGVGSYNAYSSSFVPIPAQYCEDGASDWTFGYSYSAGTFAASGNITVTLITKKAGVITAWTAKRVTSVSTINFGCVTSPWVINNNTKSVTVGVDEGGDALRGALAQGGCASCVAYDAAAANAWVSVTLAEYTKLALISSASKSVASDAVMAQTPGTYYGSSYTLTQDVNQTKIPANSYIYAMQFKTPGNTVAGTIAGTNIKVATTITGPYTNVAGNTTGTTTLVINTNYYFVLKRPTYKTIASSQFLAFYNATNYVGVTNTGTMYYQTGDVTSVPNQNAYTPHIQILSSTVKQW